MELYNGKKREVNYLSMCQYFPILYSYILVKFNILHIDILYNTNNSQCKENLIFYTYIYTCQVQYFIKTSNTFQYFTFHTLYQNY